MERQLKIAGSLEELRENLLRMGSLVEEALRKALIALSNWDEELATKVISEDARIDTMQFELQDDCAELIESQQPNGRDLREVICCIKTLTDLERIGDHARHIARSLATSAGPHYSTLLPRVRRLGDKVLGMVHDALTALIDRDPDRAREVAVRDYEADELHRAITADALSVMKSETGGVEAGEVIIQLSRFLERIGDHVTNICEWIVYAQTGVHEEFDR